MDFINLYKNFERFIEDLPTHFAEGVIENQDIFLRANRNQLRSGKRSDESNIRPLYTVDYEKFKKSIGSLTSPTPDLYVTGEFYKSIFVSETNIPGEVFFGTDYIVDGLLIGAELEVKYGEKILGPPDRVVRVLVLKIFQKQKKIYMYELSR